MLIKRICLLSLALLLTLTTVFAQVNTNKVWVEGYYRSSGTYVKGHYRTAPEPYSKRQLLNGRKRESAHG
jgi:hypothetical protein